MLRRMEGTSHSVTGADGVRIGLLTAGSGPGLLLVHGGMGTIASWRRVWGALAGQRRVTAMDRRGRGSSGDDSRYELVSEYADVAAVAAALAGEQGGPVDVVGHSFGATCVLGAAALGAPFRRIALYEPAGPQAAQDNWPERVSTMVADGQVGRATFIFLTEIIGLTRSEVEALRDAPGGRDVLPIVAATLPREARALAAADLAAAARQVRQPVLLLLGTASPPWAGQITRELAAVLPAASVTELPGTGHEGLDTAPDLLVTVILRFLGDEALPIRPAGTAGAAVRPG
jgi:pimeloyl-ACP methyl ester carboxylesterase